MIYDCFTFFNELELLEIRLHELEGVVDRFVLVESTRTFSNEPKRLSYSENKRQFSRWNSRIIPVIVDDMPESDDPWVLEHHQRNAIGRGLMECQPEDAILVSDVDEIPAARWVKQLQREPGVTVFQQRFAYYYLNNMSDAPWWGTRMVPYHRFQGLGGAQAVRSAQGLVVQEGGWHFSFIGGVQRIKSKLHAYSHQEYNTVEYTDPGYIGRTVHAKSDLFQRPINYHITDVSRLPEYVQQNRARFYDCIYESPCFHESWCDDKRCRLLGETYRRVHHPTGAVVEVGCWEGRSTVALANACFPEPLLAVDTWQGNLDEDPEHRTVQLLRERDVFRDFLRNVRAMTSGNVRPVVAPSREFFRRHSSPIKFCHIDGSHDHASVASDIRGALAWLVEGGILCGDDYASYAPGVLRAVQELLPGHEYVDTFWFWQRPSR